ncbi:hypothetical protein ABZX93_06060 [Streptomyces sp. NPDC006632]|uniref:hypothetical protein n=1 Tax=Streptomyces sp. NPDC006632 TaxID=3157182 RepID=UPI0033AEE5CF
MTTTDRPSTSGWLIDLTPEELQALVGATLTVFCGARSNTGLLTNVEEGVAYLFRPDLAEPLQYAVNGTKFERTPGTPLRPALARSLVYDREWRAKHDRLTNDDGDPLDYNDYDPALSDYEAGLVDVHDGLLMELTTQLFPTDPEDNS